MSFWKALLDPRRLPTWLAFAAALGSGVLLFAGESVRDGLGLGSFAATHEEAIGLTFLGALAFLALSGLFLLADRAAATRRRRARVDALDGAEQAILREFFLQGRNTIAVPVNDLAVAGLLTDEVLAQVGGQLQPTPKGLVAAVRIDAALRRQLTPRAVGLSAWAPPEAERRRLLDTRPAFVGEVARWDAIFQL